MSRSALSHQISPAFYFHHLGAQSESLAVCFSAVKFLFGSSNIQQRHTTSHYMYNIEDKV